MKKLMLVICYCIAAVLGYNNGVGRTPPMGWLSWERFRCVIDCSNYPNSCVSEKLYKDMADRLAEDGWKDLGYEYVNIDDCWMDHKRDMFGLLYADPKRFPNGIKGLADYVHAKGLKLGIYEDYGSFTCAGYPGSMGHEEVDAQTFASWGVDSLKLDMCHSNATQKKIGYPLMSKALNETGRPILYGCSWPLGVGGLPPAVNYTQLHELCNLWRNHDDIQDSWDSVVNTIEWYAVHQEILIPAAGPWGYNDPDMLIVGDFSLSYQQSKAQFGMWAMLAAPLLMSNDLRSISKKAVEILQNRDVIAVDQDLLGIPGRRYLNDGGIQTWLRLLSGGHYAIAVLSTRTDGTPHEHVFTLNQLNVTTDAVYSLYELFDQRYVGNFMPRDIITVRVLPSSIKMFRAVPLQFADSFNFNAFSQL